MIYPVPFETIVNIEKRLEKNDFNSSIILLRVIKNSLETS